MSSLEALKFPGSQRLLDSATGLIPILPRKTQITKSQFSIDRSLVYYKLWPEIFKWGLNEKILDVAENYLGVPVAYRGANVARALTVGTEIGTRLWHMDLQDHKILRVIIYLNDVSNAGGPFEYFAKGYSESARQSLRYSGGFVTEKMMRQHAEYREMRSCLGTSGTVVFADTANIFHRGKAPTAQDRYAIFYSYVSRDPFDDYNLLEGYSLEFLRDISTSLSDRQKASLFWLKSLQCVQNADSEQLAHVALKLRSALGRKQNYS